MIHREMFGIFLIPIMLLLGILFLVTSVTMGVGLVLKLAFWIVFLPIRIMLWMIGLIF
ncbi:MAG: hypothetical protein NWF07_01735 [Candidatus Bathyarchaeota archaeon]|nr:hypothetical protein [Candidatus Bathyarchaeota archaeon]